jgi:signal transduction histidine kinase
MNGVIGMLDLARLNPMDDETRDYLRIAQNSAQSLLVILNDILDVSKIEAGKMHIEHAPFSIEAVTRDVMQLLLPQFREKSLAQGIEISPRIPATLIGDSLRVRQVLLNLIGNALKFTRQGSILVTVDVERETPADMLIVVTVSDTGIGIPADRLETIFNAFAQADNSTTRRFGGTGLGLTISRQLVELMGGTISVCSREGEGSTFCFTLLLQRPA